MAVQMSKSTAWELIAKQVGEVGIRRSTRIRGLLDWDQGRMCGCGVAFVAGKRVLAEGYGSPIDPHKTVS
jgi:hypothetical protein